MTRVGTPASAARARPAASALLETTSATFAGRRPASMAVRMATRLDPRPLMRMPRFTASPLEPHPVLVRHVPHLDHLPEAPRLLAGPAQRLERPRGLLLRHHRREPDAQVERPPHLVLVDRPALRDRAEDRRPRVRPEI